MESEQEKLLAELTRQLREKNERAEKALDKGLAASTQTQQAKSAIQDLFGCLKGKTNGACLTIEEMNEAIALSRVLDYQRITKDGAAGD